MTLLHWASINNRKELVNLYINHGAQVDAVGGKLLATPLHWAVRYIWMCFYLSFRKILIFPFTIQAGSLSYCDFIDKTRCWSHGLWWWRIPITSFGSSVWTYCCLCLPFVSWSPSQQSRYARDDSTYVGCLQDHNVNLNALSTIDIFFLTWILGVFSVDPARLLASLGASVTSQDNNGNTALHWAIESRNVSAISLLLEKNTSLDVTNGKVNRRLSVEKKWHFGKVYHWILLGCNMREIASPRQTCLAGASFIAKNTGSCGPIR